MDTGSRILLIDDDEFVAGSLSQYLRTQGYDVDVALDATGAELLMANRQYALIVVDPYLTGGVRVSNDAIIRSSRDKQPDASLIVLTAYGSPRLLKMAADCGVSLVLTKPQSVVSVSQAIANVSARP